ncbi:MAG: hypothetical protein JWO15_991 [Sphingomonadales bacterium]|nr:hypothetical protein [Sphingomonadales bacterium]
MDEDKVGYKKPPVATRFKKGHSGNPRGRPKHQLNLKTDLLAELGELIRVNENGKTRSITKQRALLKALTARGIKGDTRASNIILKMVMEVLDPQLQATEPAELSPADDKAFEIFLKSYLNPIGDEK